MTLLLAPVLNSPPPPGEATCPSPAGPAVALVLRTVPVLRCQEPRLSPASWYWSRPVAKALPPFSPLASVSLVPVPESGCPPESQWLQRTACPWRAGPGCVFRVHCL